MKERVYLTTPLYYVNAEPHIGHSYTTIVVDTMARFHRSMGRDVFFLTGTDEHGDKIAAAARERGSEPREYADRVSALFRSTWDACGISYDHFIRTTDPYHVRFVQDVLRKVHAAGDIYFGEYGGRYCTGCERFYTDRELVEGKCPDHRTEPVWIKEENYFFRMGKYQDALLREIERRPDFVRPEGYRNEVLAMLREPLEDLCISRPKSRLQWGIELPFDDRFVTYVWFDALLNYLSALEHRKGADAPSYWQGVQHFTAKDIVKPHAIFWPTMLLAAGYPVYRHLNVHGYWNTGDAKMSKSLGNVIRPLVMKERFGMDGFRYFLMREMAFGQDASFTEDAIVTRFNADLSNGLGNLVSRVLAMQQKYFAGRIQPVGGDSDASGAARSARRDDASSSRATLPCGEDRALRDAFFAAEEQMKAHVERLALHLALEDIWGAIGACDKYVVETAPFKLWKHEERRGRVGEILHVLCDALRHSARLVEPFLPETAARIAGLLRIDCGPLSEPAPEWGVTFEPGHETAAPEPLFPRIELDKPTAAS